MPSTRDQSFEHTMSFGDHLDELRHRILLALALPIPAAIVAFFFSDTLIEWLVLPLSRVLVQHGLPPAVQVLSPHEGILTQVKLSLIAALVVSAPWILWQAWKFIAPGLYQHERRFVHLLIPGSGIMTLLGVALMYFWMLPLMLHVMVNMTQSMSFQVAQPPLDPRVAAVIEQHGDAPVPLYLRLPEHPASGQVWKNAYDDQVWAAVAADDGSIEVLKVPPPNRPVSIAMMNRLSEYVSFALLLLLAIAVAFQLPLVVLLLGWLGLASADWLRAQRRYAIMGCALAAAVLTPSTDVFSMVIMMGPLYGLYEFGILLLVLLPASAVVKGNVFSWQRWRTRTDKRREPMDRPAQPAQPELTVARTSAGGDSEFSQADEEQQR